jgi:hypothetical protein
MHIPKPIGRNRNAAMRLAISRVLRDRTSKDCTINTDTSADQHSTKQWLLAETSVASVWPETRVDIALLVSALFLQRFTLPFGNTFLHLDLVAIGIILVYQFLSGKLLIQYDRFLWFLALGFVATCSLLLNFKSTMLTGYSLFLVFYSLFTLSRPSTRDQYKRTLQAFQFLVMLLSWLGVAQFFAQFVVDGNALQNFYWIVPDILTRDPTAWWNEPRNFGGLIKSTGLFLTEPSALSQTTAIGILVEILEFHRPRCLLVMALGFLVAYSGTGLMLLLIFLPLAGLRYGKAGLSALFVVVLILGLFGTGIFHTEVFTARIGEFEETGSSGFVRFVAPILLAAKHFNTAAVQALALGTGPGTAKYFGENWYGGGSLAHWLKLFYEYGIIGSFIFCCFFASCFRRSRCPGLLIAVIIFQYLFEQGIPALAIVLCTLNSPEPRRHGIDEASRYEPSVVDRSAAV